MTRHELFGFESRSNVPVVYFARSIIVIPRSTAARGPYVASSDDRTVLKCTALAEKITEPSDLSGL